MSCSACASLSCRATQERYTCGSTLDGWLSDMKLMYLEKQVGELDEFVQSLSRENRELRRQLERLDRQLRETAEEDEGELV